MRHTQADERSTVSDCLRRHRGLPSDSRRGAYAVVASDLLAETSAAGCARARGLKPRSGLRSLRSASSVPCEVSFRWLRDDQAARLASRSEEHTSELQSPLN